MSSTTIGHFCEYLLDFRLCGSFRFCFSLPFVLTNLQVLPFFCEFSPKKVRDCVPTFSRGLNFFSNSFCQHLNYFFSRIWAEGLLYDVELYNNLLVIQAASILPIWAKSLSFHATLGMNKPAFAGVNNPTANLPLKTGPGVFVFYERMAFALNNITFHALLAFGHFFLTMRGKKISQVIFALMKISS